MGRNRLDRALISETGAIVADEWGIEELSLARVAEYLQVQPSALYNHVDGLYGMRQSISVLAMRRLLDAVRDAAVGLAREDAVRSIALAYRSFAEEHPGQYAAALLPAEPDDPDFESTAAELNQLLARVMAGFELGPDDSVHAARTLRAAVHGFVALESARAFPLDQSIDESFEILVETLLRGTEGA